MSKLLAALGLLTFATFATAQGRGIGTGSWTDGQGNTVSIRVSDPDPETPGVTVTFHDNSGQVTVPGTQGYASTPARPTASSTPAGAVNSGHQIPNQYRIREILLCGQYSARVERSTDGGCTFRPLRPAKRLRFNPRFGLAPDASPGNVGSLPGGGGPSSL